MRIAGWILTVALVLGVAAAATAQYGSDYGSPPSSSLTEQLKTAQSHATFAADADAMAGVRSHLAHVVNCLEGSRGADFNSAAGNPCQGQGNGIIPDLTARGAAAAKALATAREANAAALDAMKQAALAQAKAGATKVANLLGTALKEISQ